MPRTQEYEIQSDDIGACISQGAREPCEIFSRGTEEEDFNSNLSKI